MATDGDRDAASASSELGRRRAVTDLGEAVLARSSVFVAVSLARSENDETHHFGSEIGGARGEGGRESSLIERSADQTDDKRSIDRLIE